MLGAELEYRQNRMGRKRMAPKLLQVPCKISRVRREAAANAYCMWAAVLDVCSYLGLRLLALASPSRELTELILLMPAA